MLLKTQRYQKINDKQSRIHDLNIIIFTAVMDEHIARFRIYFVLSSEMSVYLLKSAVY